MAELKGCSKKENPHKLLNSQEMFKSLEEALKGPKPGLNAQLEMVTIPRPGDKLYFEVEDSCIKAGVLVLLYPWQNQLYLVLTRRTAQVLYHQAQISFPGGRQDQGESLRQTALREAHEEINLQPDSVRILGELTPLYIPPSNYCIYPVVAVTRKRPDFNPSKIEVEEVIELPLSHLLEPKNVQREIWTIRGVEVEVPFYLFKGHKIWGATAMVLAELVEVFKCLVSVGPQRSE